MTRTELRTLASARGWSLRFSNPWKRVVATDDTGAMMFNGTEAELADMLG